MRYIDQLLQGAEVEWKKLGEVAEIRRGRVISKGYLNENAGLYPVYSSQTENMGEIGRIRTFDFDQESITWTTDGAKAGTVFHRKGRFSITNVCGLIKIRDIQVISYRYLYYWLSIEAKKHVYSGMGNPKLMSNQVERIPIPIPPLHVQQEIVRILDKFTELETELETELDLRKQQYERYRDQLLAPDKGLAETEVEWKKLGEVCSIKTGKGVTKKDAATDGRYPIISGGKTPMGYIDVFNRQANTVTVSRVGANAGFVSYITECFYLNDKCFSAVPKESCPVIGRFLYYALKSQEERLSALQSEGGVPTINTRKLGSIPIPIPPLSEQQRIVSVLDKFHTLTTSINEGLPREIELRKQQYAYYRDQLLSFER